MRQFFVQLLTPDKTFFEGEVVRLNVTLSDGSMEILGSHMPAISGIATGKCEITLTDKTRRVFASNDGIVNIGRDKVVLLSDLLEWEEDLEKALKEREEHIAQEQQRRKQSDIEKRLSLVALDRAFAYLKKDKSSK